jgi:hypothetical protein
MSDSEYGAGHHFSDEMRRKNYINRPLVASEATKNTNSTKSTKNLIKAPFYNYLI